MRRLIYLFEAALVLLIVIKIMAAGGILQKTLFESDQAHATVEQKAPEAAPAKDLGDDPLAKERKLMLSLAEREKQLDSRENAMREEEKKLQTLKGDIVVKIDQLKALEDKLSGMLDSVKSSEDKRLKDLATVFEATTPAQAGPMLEKMDKKLAAGILMNMKSKKAGAVWGHISAEKAAAIAKEITGIKEGS